MIVNDMASVNVGRLIVKSGGMQQQEEMVELSNCICAEGGSADFALVARVREPHDRARAASTGIQQIGLSSAQTARPAACRRAHPPRRRVPTCVGERAGMESSGIWSRSPSPKPLRSKQGTSVSLNDVASLANLVTVVDCASIFERLNTMDTLVDRGWQAGKGDERTIAHLLCDQLEFANVLLVNKCDLVTEKRSAPSRSFCVRSSGGRDRAHRPPRSSRQRCLARRASMQKAAARPVVAEAREHEHTPRRSSTASPPSSVRSGPSTGRLPPPSATGRAGCAGRAAGLKAGVAGDAAAAAITCGGGPQFASSPARRGWRLRAGPMWPTAWQTCWTGADAAPATDAQVGVHRPRLDRAAHAVGRA